MELGPEDKGPTHLQNVGNCLSVNTDQHLRRLESSIPVMSLRDRMWTNAPDLCPEVLKWF